LTPGFKARYNSAVNVAVNQGLSPLVSRAARSGLNDAANRAETGEFSAAVRQDVNAFLNLTVNRTASRAMSSGLNCAFSRELNLRLNVALNAEANAAVSVRALQPAAAPGPNSCEDQMILVGGRASVLQYPGEAAALLPCSRAHTVIYI